MFIEGNLGIIEENIDFIEEEEEINNNKILNEDIIKAMQNEEDVAGVVSLVKQGHIGGCRKRADDFELEEHGK